MDERSARVGRGGSQKASEKDIGVAAIGRPDGRLKQRATSRGKKGTSRPGCPGRTSKIGREKGNQN